VRSSGLRGNVRCTVSSFSSDRRRKSARRRTANLPVDWGHTMIQIAHDAPGSAVSQATCSEETAPGWCELTLLAAFFGRNRLSHYHLLITTFPCAGVDLAVTNTAMRHVADPKSTNRPARATTALGWRHLLWRRRIVTCRTGAPESIPATRRPRRPRPTFLANSIS
jgi:hypothetical protein